MTRARLLCMILEKRFYHYSTMCFPKRENVLKMNWGFVFKKELMQDKISQFLILCKTES